MTSVDAKLIDDGQVGNACECIPTPFWAFINRKGSEKTGEDHDDVSDHSDQNVGTSQAREEGQVQEQERGGNSPVDVSGPVHLTEDVVKGRRAVLVVVLDDDLVLADAITNSHGEVGESGKGGDEGRQDVEQAFLLRNISLVQSHWALRCTYDWHTEGQDVKRNRRQEHDHKDHPGGHQSQSLATERRKQSELP